MASCPYRSLDTRLAQEHSCYIYINILVIDVPIKGSLEIIPPVYAYFLLLRSTPQTSHLKQEKWKHFPPLSVIS